ncbi:MAG: oxidoreductase-like domain-containing protein [Stenotrophobium sp.]
MNPDPKSADDDLPPRPEAPDCCGGGCAICVLDGYQDELERWEKQCTEILKQREAARAAANKP